MSPGTAAPHHFLFHIEATEKEDTSLVQSSHFIAETSLKKQRRLGILVRDGAPDVDIWPAGPRLNGLPGW